MGAVEFRQATTKDVQTFLVLQERSTNVKLYGPIGGPEQARKEIYENTLYLIRIHDDVVGSVGYRARSDQSVYVCNVVVAPEKRR